jgi:hypothetical protein
MKKEEMEELIKRIPPDSHSLFPLLLLFLIFSFPDIDLLTPNPPHENA